MCVNVLLLSYGRLVLGTRAHKCFALENYVLEVEIYFFFSHMQVMCTKAKFQEFFYKRQVSVGNFFYSGEHHCLYRGAICKILAIPYMNCSRKINLIF